MKMIYVQDIDQKAQIKLSQIRKVGFESIAKFCEIDDACLGCVIVNHKINNCFVFDYCHNSNCRFKLQSVCYAPCNCLLLIKQVTLPNFKPFRKQKIWV